MEYLTIEEIKKHLNIEADFTDDDLYLESLEGAACEMISKYIDYPLSQLEDENGDIPKAIKFAMLLWIGTIYSTRESVSNVNMNTVPHSMELLADLYRDYKIDKSE